MILAWSMLFAFLVGPPPGTSKAEIHWAASYDAAFQEANERGVPVMLLVMEDGEEANEAVWSTILQAKEFVAAAQGAVNIIGNRGKEEHHGFRMETIDGKERKVCKRFGGGIDCLTHNKMEVGIFRDFSKGGVIRTPSVIITLPDQTVVGEFVDRHPLPDYLEAFKAGRARMPDGLSWDQAVQLREQLAHAEGWIAAGEYAKVIAFANPIAALGSKAGLVERTRLLLNQVEEAGTAQLGEIEALIAAKDYLGASDRLDAVSAAFRGCRVERVAKARKAELIKGKDVKAGIAQQRRENKAREMLERADLLQGEGKAADALRLYDTLREKFADTAAGRELAARGQAAMNSGSQATSNCA